VNTDEQRAKKAKAERDRRAGPAGDRMRELDRLRRPRKRPLKQPGPDDVTTTRNRTMHAVATGALLREPCLFCGDPNVEAHHHDYTKPLEVTWLCRQHHALVHRGVRAKLTHKQRSEIRARFQAGEKQKVLAAEYGISQASVSRACR
jgi:hypothetical protein